MTSSCWLSRRFKLPPTRLFLQQLLHPNNNNVKTKLNTCITGPLSPPHKWSVMQKTSLALYLRGIHLWPVDSPHKGQVMRKALPCHNVFIHTMIRLGSLSPWASSWRACGWWGSWWRACGWRRYLRFRRWGWGWGWWWGWWDACWNSRRHWRGSLGRWGWWCDAQGTHDHVWTGTMTGAVIRRRQRQTDLHGEVSDKIRQNEIRWHEVRWNEVRWDGWDGMRWNKIFLFKEMRWDAMDKMRWMRWDGWNGWD